VEGERDRHLRAGGQQVAHSGIELPARAPISSPASRRNEDLGLSSARLTRIKVIAVTMRALRHVAVAASLGTLAAQVLLTPVEEFWPDGTPKRRYAQDDQGRKQGVYEEFAANGTRTMLAHYAQGKLHGAFREWNEAGKRRRAVVYAGDVLHGLCEEYHTDGTLHIRGEYRQGLRQGSWLEQDLAVGRVRTAEYKAGKQHGSTRVTLRGKVLTKQQWHDGELRELDGTAPFPVPRERLLAELRAILATPTPARDPADAQAQARFAALLRLRAYRHLCGLPTDLSLVPEWNRRCDAAAEVCARLGRLTHHPEKPEGIDETLYQLGAEGAARSNLHRGVSLPDSVDGYMDDSDPTNIDALGHRRWCLDPLMKRTGFGSHGEYSAMWAHDGSGKMPKGLDFVCYPPRGYVPVDMFAASYAFSIALPEGTRAETKALLVAVRTLDADYLPMDKELALDYRAVAKEGFGRGACVIFRAAGLQVEPGRRYLVEVSLDGGKSLAQRFVVEFCARVVPQATNH
jgi:hypothetical protein